MQCLESGDLLDAEDEGTAIIQNVVTFVTNDTA
jgi:hypothetical protein